MVSKGQDGQSSGNVRSTPGAAESSNDTGLMLPGFETCETATERGSMFPTPVATDAGHGHQGTWSTTGFNLHNVALSRGKFPRGWHDPATSNPLTSSAGGIRVSPSATPVDGWENPIAVGFGLSSTESFARLDPDGCWLRTYQGCCQLMMDGSLEGYSGTWPKRATMQSGSCYPLPLSVRPTSERECSLWRTPTAAETHNQDYSNQVYLQNQVKWPTPQSRDWKGQSQRGEHAPNDCLPNAVRWPTPTGDDANNATRASGDFQSLTREAGGQLNSEFVEWLMNFPKGWTEVGGIQSGKASHEPSRARRIESTDLGDSATP